MLKKELNTVKISNLDITSTSKKRLLVFLIKKISQRKKIFITTLNPEFLVFARHNSWFKKILDKADIAIPDGIGLVWASRFLAFGIPRRWGQSRAISPRLRGGVIQERISGTDLMEKLCQEAVKQNWSVYLLGGQPGVAKQTLAVLKKHYPGLRGWTSSGPKAIKTPRGWPNGLPRGGRVKVEKWIEKINQKKPDLLFVAFGMGKQEKFIWKNWEKLNVKLAIGVGGAFDYISKEIPRAPLWIRQSGLEWLYRLIRQPWRWKRQLKLLEFTRLIIKEKFYR